MNPKITFTLKEIREYFPCKSGWVKLNKTLGSDYGDTTPIAIKQIIDSNGLQDAIWCLKTKPEHLTLWKHFAIDCAETIKHLVKDERSLKALEVARNYLNGDAAIEELLKARSAADAAATYAAAVAAVAAAYVSAATATAATAAATTAAAKEKMPTILIKYCETGIRQ